MITDYRTRKPASPPLWRRWDEDRDPARWRTCTVEAPGVLAELAKRLGPARRVCVHLDERSTPWRLAAHPRVACCGDCATRLQGRKKSYKHARDGVCDACGQGIEFFSIGVEFYDDAGVIMTGKLCVTCAEREAEERQ